MWRAATSACGDEPGAGVGLRASTPEEEVDAET